MDPHHHAHDLDDDNDDDSSDDDGLEEVVEAVMQQPPLAQEQEGITPEQKLVLRREVRHVCRKWRSLWVAAAAELVAQRWRADRLRVALFPLVRQAYFQAEGDSREEFYRLAVQILTVQDEPTPPPTPPYSTSPL